MQVYTIDKFYKQLVVTGYAALNVFVETGTERQPLTDAGGVQVNNLPSQLFDQTAGIIPLENQKCFFDKGM